MRSYRKVDEKPNYNHMFFIHNVDVPMNKVFWQVKIKLYLTNFVYVHMDATGIFKSIYNLYNHMLNKGISMSRLDSELRNKYTHASYSMSIVYIGEIIDCGIKGPCCIVTNTGNELCRHRHKDVTLAHWIGPGGFWRGAVSHRRYQVKYPMNKRPEKILKKMPWQLSWPYHNNREGLYADKHEFTL